jgi:hypothetical protein
MPNASGGAPNYNDASSSHSFTRTRSNSPPKIRVLSGRSVSPPKMGSGGRRSSGEGRRGGGSAGGGTRLISDIREPAFGGAGGRPTTSDASWRGGGGAKVALMNRHLDDQVIIPPHSPEPCMPSKRPHEPQATGLHCPCILLWPAVCLGIF